MCVYVSLIYIEFRPLNHCNSWTPGARMDLKIAMDSPKSSLSNEPSPMPLTAIISEIIKASDSSEFWRLLGIVEIIIIKASDSSEFWRLLGIVDILFFFFYCYYYYSADFVPILQIFLIKLLIWNLRIWKIQIWIYIPRKLELIEPLDQGR